MSKRKEHNKKSDTFDCSCKVNDKNDKDWNFIQLSLASVIIRNVITMIILALLFYLITQLYGFTLRIIFDFIPYKIIKEVISFVLSGTIIVIYVSTSFIVWIISEYDGKKRPMSFLYFFSKDEVNTFSDEVKKFDLAFGLIFIMAIILGGLLFLNFANYVKDIMMLCSDVQ